MDRQAALEAFNRYVSAYDPSNPRIALKVDHTLRVARLCERIAREAGFSDSDVDMAWMLGLLHDIGRFEQVRRYDTFNDAVSVNHAVLGAQVLFDERERDDGEAGASPLIRRFLPDDSHDALVRTAVELHSAYRLPDGLDGLVLALSQVLRDADKVDILKVNCICPIEDIYGVPERSMRESEVSPECVALFYEHRCLPRNVRRYPADIMLGHICFAWELVYEPSLRVVCEQGYLHRMLDYPWELQATRESFARMKVHMQEQLGLA